MYTDSPRKITMIQPVDIISKLATSLVLTLRVNAGIRPSCFERYWLIPIRDMVLRHSCLSVSAVSWQYTDGASQLSPRITWWLRGLEYLQNLPAFLLQKNELPNSLCFTRIYIWRHRGYQVQSGTRKGGGVINT